MSTVLLSPTHIASDHTVVYRSHPHSTVVDPDFRKVFMAPNHRFLIGTCGDYFPSNVDTPETYALVERLITRVIRVFEEKSQHLGPFSEDEDTKAFAKVFDVSGSARHFVVTSRHRFVIYWADDKNMLAYSSVGAYNGIGTGGFIGAGLLLGGADINSLWEDLHKLDGTTSVAHTVVSLDTLKDWGTTPCLSTSSDKTTLSVSLDSVKQKRARARTSRTRVRATTGSTPSTASPSL